MSRRRPAHPAAAGLRHSCSSGRGRARRGRPANGLGIDDVGSAIKQEIEWGAGTGPINARLYGRPPASLVQSRPHSRFAVVAIPPSARTQRLPDRDRIGAGK